MNRQIVLSFSLAITSFALLSPQLSKAVQTQASQDPSNVNTSAARNEAVQMVPASAVLNNALNASKIKSGDQFKATLSSTVHLKDGTELKRGTVLVGVITTDNMQKSGGSSLALRFTQANLKDGKTIPIKATIISIGGPQQSGIEQDYNDQPPMGWNQSILQVDQLKAVKGADLHSRIAGSNSGVFVSNNGDDVKLAAQSQLSLALTARSSGNASPNGGA